MDWADRVTFKVQFSFTQDAHEDWQIIKQKKKSVDRMHHPHGMTGCGVLYS